jgi:hypothetical protein
MIGWYRTQTFADRFPDYATFLEKYTTSGLTGRLEIEGEYGLETIFNLLAIKYCDDHMKSSNPGIFELKVFKLIWEHGPKWQRDMKLYDQLRNLTNTELSIGSQAVHNHAEHPDAAPVTTSVEGIGFIDSQNVTTYVKSPKDRVVEILELENSTLTEEFLAKFSPLFTDILYPSGSTYFEI